MCSREKRRSQLLGTKPRYTVVMNENQRPSSMVRLEFRAHPGHYEALRKQLGHDTQNKSPNSTEDTAISRETRAGPETSFDKRWFMVCGYSLLTDRRRVEWSRGVSRSVQLDIA